MSLVTLTFRYAILGNFGLQITSGMGIRDFVSRLLISHPTAACVVLHASNIGLVLLQEITLSGPRPSRRTGLRRLDPKRPFHLWKRRLIVLCALSGRLHANSPCLRGYSDGLIFQARYGGRGIHRIPPTYPYLVTGGILSRTHPVYTQWRDIRRPERLPVEIPASVYLSAGIKGWWSAIGKATGEP